MTEQSQELRMSIERALKQRGVVSIQKPLIDAMDGDIVGGLFVSQLLFWSGRTKHFRGWFYRSQKQWREEDFIGRYRVDKYVHLGREAGWLQTKLEKAAGAPVTHYRIDYAVLATWLEAKGIEISADGNAGIDKSLETRGSANPIHTPTVTDTQTEPSPTVALGSTEFQEDGGRAAERGRGGGNCVEGVAVLSQTVAVLTGLTAAVDADRSGRWRYIAEETASTLLEMGFESVSSLRQLAADWKIDNAWRHTRPSPRNLIEYASQRRAGEDGLASAPSPWDAINDNAPDYMNDGA